MSNGQNGFRQKKQQSSKDKLRELQVAVANMQQMSNIQKIVAQQMSQNLAKQDRDINNAMSVLNDLQYRTLATLEVLTEVFPTITTDQINDKAEEMKLKDYNEASDKEDLEKGYVEDDVIGEESIVILTSECLDDENKSIFRTKFKMDEEVLVGELKDKLLGLKTGETVEAKLPDGNTHKLEIVGIRKATAKPEDSQQPQEEQASLQ